MRRYRGLAMADDIQRRLERDIRISDARAWARGHRPLVAVLALMLLSFAAGAGVALIAGIEEEQAEVADGLADGVAATSAGHEVREEDVTAYVSQYRAYAGYLADQEWATYLDGMAIDAEGVREEAIRVLARGQAVRDRAAELGVSATDEEIGERLAAEVADAGGDPGEWEAYATGKLMYADASGYRADIETKILLDRLLDLETAPIEPTDIDLVTYAASSPELYTGARTYDALFPVGAKAPADEVADALDAAQALHAGLAEALGEADDPATPADLFMAACEGAADIDGGKARDRGWTCVEEPSSAYLSAVMATPVGGVTEPFRDAEGWHVTFVAETFAERPDTVLSVRRMPPDLYEQLRVDAYESMLADAYAAYADGLVDAAGLEIAPMPAGLPYDVDMGLSLLRDQGDGADGDGDDGESDPFALQDAEETDEG